MSLKADLEFLKEKLEEPKPRLPLIAQLAQGIIGSLPSELIGALAGSLLGQRGPDRRSEPAEATDLESTAALQIRVSGGLLPP